MSRDCRANFVQQSHDSYSWQLRNRDHQSVCHHRSTSREMDHREEMQKLQAEDQADMLMILLRSRGTRPHPGKGEAEEKETGRAHG